MTLRVGQQMPPVPIWWRGREQPSTVLRGAATLLLFPCAIHCSVCRTWVDRLLQSQELQYWAVRVVWVAGAGEKQTADADRPVLGDLHGRLRAWLGETGTVSLVLLDEYLELKRVISLEHERMPEMAEVEKMALAELAASPG